MSIQFFYDWRQVAVRLISAAICAVLIAGCAPEINYRGYYAKSGAFGQLSEGMSKSEVEAILGSPSTTASANVQGDSYYYITSVTQGRAFLRPKEVKREVIAVRFDREDRVTSVAQYGLEDGKIININDRQTPVPGSDVSILRELFGGVTAVPGLGTGG
jgi:outer membrane protein assembly factor BamE (lipoprotein component of BamABCDE complex)